MVDTKETHVWLTCVVGSRRQPGGNRNPRWWVCGGGDADNRLPPPPSGLGVQKSR